MSVSAAVERDLVLFEERLEGVSDSSLAAAALALAAELDDEGNSATSKSMCARELREHMDRLRALLPPEQEEDDELAKLRARDSAASTG